MQQDIHIQHSLMWTTNCTPGVQILTPDFVEKLTFTGCLNDLKMSTNHFNACIVEMALGASHSLFVADDGWVFASGSSDRGQLGDPYFDSTLRPLRSAHHFKVNKCVKVGAGDGFSIILTETVSLQLWAGNYGRLEHSHRLQLSKPAIIDYVSNSVVCSDHM